MDRDIDAALSRLTTASPHPGLAGLEDRVLHSIANQPPRSPAFGTTAGAAAFALMFGVFSNTLPLTPARAAPPTVLVGTPGPLAPSSLLLEPR